MISLNELIILGKHRGWIYQSSDIYGGVGGVYDFGPLGVLLKRNIESLWWKNTVENDIKTVGLDSSIIMEPIVWEASGHTKGFNDPVTFSKKTGKRFRVDHLLEKIGISVDGMSLEELQKIFKDNQNKLHPDEENSSDLTMPTFFNLLATSNIGNTTGEYTTYLRGETCQGIYVNYKNIINSTHLRLPFGVAQIGKVFRNEISARQFLFRLREFSQMELEYFCSPDNATSLYDLYKKKSFDFLVNIGINKDKLRFNDHDKLVFYAKAATDIEYKFPFGWKELQGVHNRGDHDLKTHQKHSKVTLEYMDEETAEKYIPNVIETSMSVERLFLTILFDGYVYEELKDKTSRTVLKINHNLAPYKIAILPLMKREILKEKATEVYTNLTKLTSVYYDETQSIGRRYRRQDEIGTPYCVTIDYNTLESDIVTIRDRDTMQQETKHISELTEYFKEKFNF